MPGPLPKPTKMKILEGNPGRKPLNRNEPQPREGIPTRPQWLSVEAKRTWTRLAGELDRMGLLSIIDRETLAAYCDTWGDIVELTLLLREYGRTFTTETGYVTVRPEVAIRNKAYDRLATYGAKLGLDPASRSRISLPTAKEEDALDAILRGTG